MSSPIGHSQLQNLYKNTNKSSDFGEHTSEVAAPTHDARRQVMTEQRTVAQITSGPLFNNLNYLLNPEELKAFKAHTGDWDDHRLPLDVQKANALKAEAVLRFIDGQGGAHSTAGNNKIDGANRSVPMLLNPGSEYFSIEGSEARWVLEFARGGYPALMDAANDAAQKTNAPLGPKPVVSDEANVSKPVVSDETNVSSPPSREEKRPAGDQRSALDIFYDNPMLNAGIMQEVMESNPRDDYPLRIRNGLIKQVGDFTRDNPDPESRADAMYRLARVAQFINNDPGLTRYEDGPRESQRLSGNLNDPSGELFKMARFARYGYRVLTES